MRSGALLLAATLVVSLALAGCTSNTDDGPTGPLVQMTGFDFTPKEITIEAGTTVTWKNPESTPHTVTSDTDLFESGDLGRGGTFTFTFDTPGTYTYHCIPHSWEDGGKWNGMIGTITVTGDGDASTINEPADNGTA